MNVPTLEHLYLNYYDLVYRCIYHLIPNNEDAEDLTHDTFLRALKALPNLKHTTHLGGWLYTIATNIARDARRKRRTVLMSPLDDLHNVRSSDSDLQAVCETRDCIERALGGMTPAYQHIWQARYQHGFTHQDLIALTGYPPRQVYNLMFNTRKAFRRSYQREVTK